MHRKPHGDSGEKVTGSKSVGWIHEAWDVLYNYTTLFPRLVDTSVWATASASASLSKTSAKLFLKSNVNVILVTNINISLNLPYLKSWEKSKEEVWIIHHPPLHQTSLTSEVMFLSFSSFRRIKKNTLCHIICEDATRHLLRGCKERQPTWMPNLNINGCYPLPSALFSDDGPADASFFPPSSLQPDKKKKNRLY